MSHIWDDKVVGGVGIPKIYALTSNYCDNPYFDINTDGWNESLPGIMSRILDEDAYSEYMLNIDYSSDREYVYYEKNIGEAILDKVFLANIRIKASSEQEMTIAFNGNSEFGATNFTVDENIKQITISAQAASQTGNTIALIIYGTAATGDADIYIDQIYFSEVVGEYTFPQPQRSSMKFEKVNYGENELWDGKIQEFNKRWRPHYNGIWDCFNAISEIYRQEISESDVLFCKPHDDIEWGFLALWDGDLERRYAFDRFIGHYSVIALKGIELITSKPKIQSGLGSYSIEDDEVVVI